MVDHPACKRQRNLLCAQQSKIGLNILLVSMGRTGHGSRGLQAEHRVVHGYLVGGHAVSNLALVYREVVADGKVHNAYGAITERQFLRKNPVCAQQTGFFVFSHRPKSGFSVRTNFNDPE